MIETPAATLILGSLREDAAFFSVGTNDLVQYLLCVDRANQSVETIFDPLHPAVVRTLKRIAREAGDTPITICGEMAADKQLVPLLLGMGFRRFSMPVPSIPAVKSLVSKLKIRECKQLFKACDQAQSASELHALTEVFLKAHDGA